MILRVDETQFREILRLGLGRAIIYARLHDMREFRDVILDACLHCYAYDIQCEGTRGWYMQDLVGGLPDKEFYHGEVLKSLAGSGDDYDAVQRFHFAACLAFDGNQEAKRVMYEHYNPGPRMGELIGTDFLQMDGISGLLFVANKIGALLIVKPEAVHEGLLLRQSFEICGEQATWEALREAGAMNPRIERYRLAAEEESRRPPSGQLPEITSLRYEQLSSELLNYRPLLLSKWGQQASDAELELAATGLTAEKDSKQQLARLRIFAWRRFPLDVQTILALVDIEEDRVGLAAMAAVAHIVHPAVRALAFRLVDTRASWRGDAIDLMAQNFEPGDHRIILRWFQEEEDRETLHSMGLDFTDFWKRHPDEESEIPMLLALYEEGPCSVCRKTAVWLLMQRGALTDQLRAERVWDANDEIRDLVSAGQVADLPQ
jgi:hypothetical protein